MSIILPKTNWPGSILSNASADTIQLILKPLKLFAFISYYDILGRLVGDDLFLSGDFDAIPEEAIVV